MSLCQSESSGDTIPMKMFSTHRFLSNQIHFHLKGFAQGLVRSETKAQGNSETAYQSMPPRESASLNATHLVELFHSLPHPQWKPHSLHFAPWAVPRNMAEGSTSHNTQLAVEESRLAHALAESDKPLAWEKYHKAVKMECDGDLKNIATDQIQD